MTACESPARRRVFAAAAVLWIVLAPARGASATATSAPGSAATVSPAAAAAPEATTSPTAAAAPEATTSLAPAAAVAAVGDIRISEDGARWENAYGEKFFQVVGSVTNGGAAPVGAVRVRVELLDTAGAVVAAYEGWNGRAEALGDLEGAAARAKLAELLPAPIAPGESDRFRSTFLGEETPDFRSHRMRVLAVLPPT